METPPTPRCAIHPDSAAAGRCVHCTGAFCADCLVDFLGGRFCGRCRDQRLAQMQGAASTGGPQTPPTVLDHIIPTRNPPALTAYYLGVFSLVPCLGLALGPAALAIGIIAIRAVRRTPMLPGRGHAVAGIVLGAVTSLLNWGVVVVAAAGLLLQRNGP